MIYKVNIPKKGCIVSPVSIEGVEIYVGLNTLLINQRIRLLGVEVGKNIELKAKSIQRLRELIFKSELEVEIKNSDMYGRWLGTIYKIDGNTRLNINEILLAEGLVEKYELKK